MPANNSMLKYTLIRLRRNYLAVLGFIVLSLSYFIAEQLGVLVDIARNTRK